MTQATGPGPGPPPVHSPQEGLWISKPLTAAAGFSREPQKTQRPPERVLLVFHGRLQFYQRPDCRAGSPGPLPELDPWDSRLSRVPASATPGRMSPSLCQGTAGKHPGIYSLRSLKITGRIKLLEKLQKVLRLTVTRPPRALFPALCLRPLWGPPFCYRHSLPTNCAFSSLTTEQQEGGVPSPAGAS